VMAIAVIVSGIELVIAVLVLVVANVRAKSA
jgi:hypothetical protein